MKVIFKPHREPIEATMLLSNNNEANFPITELPYEYEIEIYEQMYWKLKRI